MKTRNHDILSIKLPLNRRLKYFLCHYWILNLMVLLGVVYFLVFRYAPMAGLIVAFKNYKGAAGGFTAIFQAKWVGLTWFQQFFNSIYFGRVFGNTLIISVMRLALSFPAPILLALLLNEVRSVHFKKTVQTITYMPYFLSWVVVAGLMGILLSPTNGPVNVLIEKLGGTPVFFLGSSKHFRWLLVFSEIWKNVGYSAIVYLAAITSVDVEQYEAALVDGANKFQQMLHITLPSIGEIIAIMLILSVGRILDDNFEQVYNLYSTAVYDVADVFGTYVYRTGITDGKYSYGAAVGLFKSVVALILILLTNKAAKAFGSQGLF